MKLVSDQETARMEHATLWAELKETQRQVQEGKNILIGGIWIVIGIQLIVVGILFLK